MKAFALPEYILLLDVILLNVVVESTYTDPIVYPTSYDDLQGTYTNYTFFETKRPWNEAREVCKSIGGDLAKIPSYTDVNAMKDAGIDVEFLTKNYFSSAVRHSADQFLWVSDCTSDTLPGSSSIGSFKDTFVSSVCLEVHGDHFHNTNCDDDESMFLCETKTRTPCNLVKIPDTEYVIFDYKNESDCNELCNGDVTCWAAITTPTHCIKATVPESSSSSQPMSTKQCHRTYDVHIRQDEVDLTAANITDDLERSYPPVCGNYTGNSSLLPNTASPNITTNQPVTSSYALPNPTSPGQQLTTMYVTSTEHFVCPTEYVTTTVTATVSSQIGSVTATVSSQIGSVTATVSSQIGSVTATSTSSGVVNDQVDMQLIPPKSTSTYRRSLTSAMDMRRTSIVIGSFSVALVIIPLWTIMFSDMKAIIRHFRNHRTIYSK